MSDVGKTTKLPLVWKVAIGSWATGIGGAVISFAALTLGILGVAFQGAHPPALFFIGLGLMGWGALVAIIFFMAGAVKEL